MKACELICWLEKEYPSSAAENWDNVGLLVGDDQKETFHIFLALDLTDKVLEEAVACGADMILTHHPMIFSGMKKINTHDFTGRKVIRLIREDIPYYAMHTNYDILGMADLSAEYIGISKTSVLSVTEDGPEGVQGFGRVGDLPKEMSLGEYAGFVKDSLKLKDVRVYGDLDMPVKRAAICTGSGKSMIPDAMAAGADVYVTGDIDHHTGIDALQAGLAVIDAGHYGTEYIFMEAMKKRIQEVFGGLKVTCAKVQCPYTLLADM
nr:Nif3-like dinuclear metal center hexameric protein [uncultured Blautia sp.]